MTAQAVASSQISPAPPPAAVQASVIGQNFSTILSQTAPPPPPAATSASSASSTGATAASKPQANSRHGSGNGSTTAVVVPLPVPLVLAQPPVNIAAAGTKTAAAPATPPAPAATAGTATAAPEGPSLVSTALDAATSIGFSLTAPGAAMTAAKLLGAAIDAATAAGASPTPAAAATPAATSTTASGPALPPMAATLSLRLAASANNLVSQPRAALASVAPDKVSAPATAADEAAPLADAPGSDAAKPALATASGIGADLLAAAKDPSIAPALLQVPTTGATPASTSDSSSTSDTGAADAASQAAALVPAQPQTATTDAIATQALPIMSHAAAEQVAVSLRQAVSNGDDHIQIQLQPADLGAVAVKLSINHDGRVTMVVSADRSDTLNMLQQDSGSLTQALRDAGLSADSSSLSFNLRGGFQSNQQSAGGNGAGGGSSTDALDAAAPLPAARLSTHSGSLDIHV